MYFSNRVADFRFSPVEAATMVGHLERVSTFGLLLALSGFGEANFGRSSYFDEGGGGNTVYGNNIIDNDITDNDIGRIAVSDSGGTVFNSNVDDWWFVGTDDRNCTSVRREDNDDVTDVSGRVLSRQKRNFGGREPIDYVKAVNATFLVAGWVAQGCEAFNDIQFHLLGYTVLGEPHPAQLFVTKLRATLAIGVYIIAKHRIDLYKCVALRYRIKNWEVSTLEGNQLFFL